MNLTNVDIILLSAGIGRRLVNCSKPKSLLLINNETLILD